MGDLIPGVIALLQDFTATELGRRLVRWDAALPLPDPNLLNPGAVAPALPRPSRPPRPAPGNDPALLAFWNELDFGPSEGDIQLDASNVKYDMRPAPRGEVANGSNTAGLGSRMSSSLNWSGAMLRAQGGLRFNAAAARWRIPDARRPAPALLFHPEPELPLRLADLTDRDTPLPKSWRCSIWVGLDGHRLSSLSLPQIGTTTEVKVVEEGKDAGLETTKAYAWAQWWVRGKMYGEVRFPKAFSDNLAPGHRITAWVALLAPDLALLRMRNETTGKAASVVWRSGEVGGEGQIIRERHERSIHRRPAPAEGGAAVFVVERPMVMPPRDPRLTPMEQGDQDARARPFELYPLPEFDEVVFENCAAAMHDPARDGFGVARRLVDLRHAQMIRMMRQGAPPFHSRRYAVPRLDPAERGMVVAYRG